MSIVLPVFNGSNTLEKCIDSILKQTFKDFIIYICDDASTDKSLDLINRMKSKKINLSCNKNNMGLSKTRKKILQQIEGKYIAFIDQDDLWFKDKLKIQIDVLEKYNCVMCHSNYIFNNVLLNYKKKMCSDKIINYKNLVKGASIGASTVLINRKIYSKKINFCADRFYDSCNDYVIWLNILRPSTKQHFSYGVNDVLVEYTFHGKNLSRNKITQLLKHICIIRKLENFSLFETLFISFINLINRVNFHFFK